MMLNTRTAVLMCATGLIPSLAAASSLTLTSGLTVNRTPPVNLFVNGSFEDGAGRPDATTGMVYWATGTSLAGPFAVPTGWSSVGGTAAYALWTYDTAGPYCVGSDTLPHGNRALYFGNQFASAISQTPTFNATTGEVTFANPPVITPKDPTYSPAVQLSQTITGLNINAVYKFSFWTSGEMARYGNFLHDGIFGLDVTGFNTIYLACPGGAGANTVGASKLYEFYLQPAASATTFTWTNWGHFGQAMTTGWGAISPASDELVLDDVVLNFDHLVPEPASLSLLVIGSLLMTRRRGVARP